MLTILAGLAAGFAIGQLSRPQSALPQESEDRWTYRIPELSDEVSQSYRTTLAKAGSAVAEAMQAHPHSPSAVSALGLLHYLAHDSDGERRCWERCLQLDPRNSLAYSRLVALAQQNADYDRVVQLMQEALRHDPQSATYRGLLGSALMYLNRPEEARQHLERMLAAGHADVDAYLLLGEVYYQLDQPEKASRYLSLASDLAPQRPDTLHSLAKVYQKLGKADAAKEVLARFQALKEEQLVREATREEVRDEKFMPPRIAEILNFVGKSYLEAGELDLAKRRFEEAAATSDRDVESRKILAQLATNEGKWEEALAFIRELRQIEPANSVHYWNEGILYERTKQYDDAERVFRDFCRLQPAEDSGYAALAAMYLRSNRNLNEARSLAERAVELAPTARNLSLLGSIAKSQGDVSTARAALERAAELDPKNAEVAAPYESVIRP